MKTLFVAWWFLWSVVATATIVPENDLWIGVDEKSAKGGITEKDFNEVLDLIHEVYAPIVKAKGKTLYIWRDWKNGTVNAYAQQMGQWWVIRMFGGLARHPTITKDGFMLVACHEMGHHLGGEPRYTRNPWASVEGQADLFGTSKCFKRVLEHNGLTKEDSEEVSSDLAYAFGKCEKNYRYWIDKMICMKGVLAGKSLANLFAALRRKPSPLFAKPDSTIVTKTYEGHPNAQCRLDTYFQGALCHLGFDRPEYCVRPKDVLGVRPLCWYKPKE